MARGSYHSYDFTHSDAVFCSGRSEAASVFGSIRLCSCDTCPHRCWEARTAAPGARCTLFVAARVIVDLLSVRQSNCTIVANQSASKHGLSDDERSAQLIEPDGSQAHSSCGAQCSGTAGEAGPAAWGGGGPAARPSPGLCVSTKLWNLARIRLLMRKLFFLLLIGRQRGCPVASQSRNQKRSMRLVARRRQTRCGSSSCWEPTRTSPTRCCWIACGPAAPSLTPWAPRRAPAGRLAPRPGRPVARWNRDVGGLSNTPGRCFPFREGVPAPPTALPKAH